MLVNQPPLAQAAADAARLAPGPAAVTALNRALVAALGPEQVSPVVAARRAASTDFAHMSPLLIAALPDRSADVVAFPRSVEELAAAVRLAHEHGVPVTPRGAGTGNYGQAVPLAGGLVVDLTRCDRVFETGDGWLRAEAGATFVALEAAARRCGQEIAMMPTTVGSTLGGFLAGGAGGVGSIEHGWLWDGFVIALAAVRCPPAEAPMTASGADCLPFLHAYGVTGIIASATVRLAPARTRVAVLASFPSQAGTPAAAAALALVRMEPPPRLVSLDEPDLVALFPPDPGLPAGHHSLRAIVDSAAVADVRGLVEAHGGRVEDVRPRGAAYVSTLAFNHVTLRARRTRPDLCHLQLSGAALIDHPDRVRAALPGSLLHLDGLRTAADPVYPGRGRHFGGLLLSPFRGGAELYAGIARLLDLGVHVVDPHTWLLGGPALPAIRASAATNDPDGLLNPGKLPL
jgi:FAD/FMN-containing dehydrogenase